MPSQATQQLQPRVARRHWTILAALAFALSTVGVGTAGLTAPLVSAAAVPVVADAPTTLGAPAPVVVPDDAATIAAALAIVEIGGTIHVRAGTHAGGFVIDKAVTLEGEGWGSTIVDGTGTPGDAITIQLTGGVTVRDLKVRETAPGIGIHLVSAGGNTIDHVWTDGGRFGVSFTSAASDNTVVDSRASNAVEWAFEGGDTGSSGNTYCRVEAWGSQGGIVAYAGSNGTTVVDSNLHGNGVGFQMGWSSGWSITGSTLTGNANGILVDTTWGGSIADNEITNNSGAGVVLSGLGTSGTTVSGNRISHNGGAGIRFNTGASSNTIRDNEISGNAIGIQVERSATLPNFGNRMFHNRLIDNAIQAIGDEERNGGNAWDDGYPSGGNFWYDHFAVDAASGPAQDQPGADGIIDTPWPVPGANGAADVDRYPMVVGEAPSVRIGGWQFNPATGHYYAQVDGRNFANLDSTDSNPTARLVTINDQAEQDWLSSHFTAQNLVIGLNDLDEEGTWTWRSGEPVTYTNWVPGEPNSANLPIGGEDIAVMNWRDPNPPYGLGWNDVPNIGWHSGIIETATPSTGGIRGTVRTADTTGRPSGPGELQPGDPLPWMKALALSWDAGAGEWTYAGEARSADDGTFEITELLPGEYIVRFACDYPGCDFDTQYWNGVGTTEAAAHVTVAAGPSLTGVDAAMHLRSHGSFAVNPGSGWIAGNGFAPGASITVARNGEPLGLGDIGTDQEGNFWVDNEAITSIAVGDTIAVSDGVVTKETVVRSLRIDGVDSNVVRGWAEAGPVRLDVWNSEVNRTVDIGGDGSWSVDVSVSGPNEGEGQTTTLGAGDGMSASVADEDGDTTHADFGIPNPRFTVSADGDWVQGDEFAPDADIDITVNGQPAGGVRITTDRTGWFWLDNQNDPDLDLAIGDTITVSDGSTTKTTVLTGLRVDSITETTVSGWAATTDVQVSVWDTEVSRHEGVVDHAWSADVSKAGDEDWEQATTTLGPGSGGNVTEADPDGDATQVDWSIPNPRIYAELTYNGVNGEDFGGPVTVTITDPTTAATGTWSGPQIGYDGTWFYLSLDDVAGPAEPWRLAPGQLVTVASAGATKSLTLPDLTVTGWDLEANTVEGTSSAEGRLVVDVGHDEMGASMEMVSTGGPWFVDFDDANEPYDIGIFDEARVTQFDEDGDGTIVQAGILGPARFAVGPTFQEIVGSDWPDGATVTLTIDRPSLPGDIDFTAHVTAGSGCDTQDTCFNGYLPTTGDANAYFNLTTGTFWVMAGDVVTMTDGATIKTQVVPDLQPGLGDDDVNVVDGDGDSTFVPAPTPGVVLEPATDRIWAGNFAKGSVTVTIERPAGTVVHSQTVETQNVLTRGSWNLDMWTQPIGNLDRPTMALFDLDGFDLQAGDIVTVTDRVSTDRSVVADLTVDSISAETDIVSGHATREVALHLGEGEGGYWGYFATPDGGGTWTLTFTPGVFPNPMEGLTPGMTGQAMIDNTVVRWTVPGSAEPTVITADDQTAVYGAGLPTLTWTAGDPGVVWTQEPECTTTAVADSPVGTYPISCTGASAAGYTVIYVDGTLTISPADLVITAVSTGRAWGAANPAFEFTADLLFADVLATPPSCTTTATPASPVGTYPIVCSGAADANYDISYVDGTLTVVKAAQTIDFGPLANATVGDPPMSLHATASSGLPVTFIATTPSVCTLKKGSLTFVIAGTCTVQAIQAGNAQYLSAPPVLASVSVSPAASVTVLTSSRATAVVGQTVTLTARVTGPAGNPTGPVTFTDGASVLGTVALTKGQASISVTSLGVGAHAITAVYGGSPAYAGSTGSLAGGVSVAKAATDVIITNASGLSHGSTRIGVSYEVRVRVVAVSPGSGIPAGLVAVSDGTVTCTFTLAADGTGSCWLTSTSAGTKTIVAAYQGSPSYLVDTAAATHVVKR